MRIAIWLIGVVSATWACGTMASPQGKRITRVLRQVACEKLVVFGGLYVESWFVLTPTREVAPPLDPVSQNPNPSARLPRELGVIPGLHPHRRVV